MAKKHKHVRYIVSASDIPIMGIGYLTDRGTWVSDIRKATKHKRKKVLKLKGRLGDVCRLIKVTTIYESIDTELEQYTRTNNEIETEFVLGVLLKNKKER